MREILLWFRSIDLPDIAATQDSLSIDRTRRHAQSSLKSRSNPKIVDRPSPPATAPDPGASADPGADRLLSRLMDKASPPDCRLSRKIQFLAASIHFGLGLASAKRRYHGDYSTGEFLLRSRSWSTRGLRPRRWLNPDLVPIHLRLG